MFFRAPPSSTPTTSVLVNTQKFVQVRIFWAFRAASLFAEATTAAAIANALPDRYHKMIDMSGAGADLARDPKVKEAYLGF